MIPVSLSDDDSHHGKAARRCYCQYFRHSCSLADDLWIISRTGGGLDNVDVTAATQQEIIVTSNLGVNTSSVVEHALALMLALAKQLPIMDRDGNLPRNLWFAFKPLIMA